MKRIISLIMSVLMIATVFCGFAVTSTAADGENYVTTTIDLVDNGDGTYNVQVWAKDETPYGFVILGIELVLDDKLEFVPYYTAEWTPPEGGDTKMKDYILDVTPAYNFRSDTLNTSGDTDAMITMGGDINTKLERKKAFLYSPMVIIKSSAPPSNAAIQFTQEYFDHCYDDLWIDEPIVNATFDAQKGMLLAEAVVQAKAGASGDAVITTATNQLAIAVGSNKGATVDKVGCSTEDSVTINLGSGEPEEPTLPEGITLEVLEGVSARTADPAGIRFVANVTADDFSVISEMGVAITDGNKTLMIPARVDKDGNYLQAFTTGEDGKKVFEDGVIASESATFTGVLSKIKDANKGVEFTAKAYVVVDGNVFFSESYETGSYNDVMNAAANDDYIA